MSSFVRAGWQLAFPGTSLLGRPGGVRAGRRLSTLPRLAAATLAVPLGVLLAGCAGQVSVALPGKAAARSPARLADQPGIRQQVLAAYAGYWIASDEALNTGSAGRARQILARYAPASAVPALIRAFRQDWARHAVTDGSPVPHVLSIGIRNGRATVHDCIDLSHAGLRNASTGRIFPHSFGSPRANYYASLVRQDGRWLVSNILPVEAQCAP